MDARRLSGAFLALVALGTVGLRLYLRMEGRGWDFGETVWFLARYFTLWTNFLIGLLGVWLALGRRVPQALPAMLLLAIVAVALVYHALLAGSTSYQGIDMLVDDMLHTVIPLAFAAHWLLLEPKDRIGFRDLPLWLCYPAVYCVYALIRGAATGRYPYFFLDPSRQGVAGIAAWIAALLVAFALGGALIVLTARAMSRRRPVAG